MPYKNPKKVKGGWVLPKKTGGYHRSKKGKIVKFKTKKSAKKVARFLNAIEHGWKPTKLPKPALKNLKVLRKR
jgi:hypothetical protein